MDISIYKILPNVDNKLIKANFKDLVTFRINISFIQTFEINMHYEIKQFLKCLNRCCNMV